MLLNESVIWNDVKHVCNRLYNAHNHPSGIAEPSQADQRITQRLQEALSLVDVRVIDHMVVGDKEVISFAERGLL